MNFAPRYVGIALALLAPLGCGSGSSGSGSSPPPTWTQVYSDIIGPTCAMPCHNPNGPGVMYGMLDMSTQQTAYMNLVNVMAAGTKCAGKGTRIVPGMPDMSILYLKASDDDPAPCGNKMPDGTNGLAAAQSDEIQAWIAAGANP
jgi:hypothetical protein